MSEEKSETPLHEKNFQKSKNKMLNTKLSQQLSKLFKVLDDPTRLKILSALSENELCVHDLATLLGISQSAVSHQLRKLKDARIVKFRKTGRTVFYSLDDEHIEKLLEMGIKHTKEE